MCNDERRPKMATLVRIKEVKPGGQLSKEFYYNVDQVIRLSFNDNPYQGDNVLYWVVDKDRSFTVDQDNLDIILNACHVV